MSSPENRTFNADVQLLSLLPTSSVATPTAITYGGAVSLLAIFTDCKVNINATTMKAKASRDIADVTNIGLGYKRAVRRSWGVDLGQVLDMTLFINEFIIACFHNAVTGSADQKEQYKGLVQARIFRPGTGLTAGNAGYSYVGAAYINGKLSITSEGPIIDKATLRGYGPLTKTGT